MKEIGSELLSWIKTIVGVSVLVWFVHSFVFIPVEVEGASMYPTLKDSDKLMVWQLNYEPKPFDVVVFEVELGQFYVKRIIGMPGQSVRYENEQLMVDEEVVEQPFLKDDASSNVKHSAFTADFTLQELCQFSSCEVIPEGYYLVLGDNRSYSEDSRHIGLIHESDIMGKAVFTMWPFKHAGQIN